MLDNAYLYGVIVRALVNRIRLYKQFNDTVNMSTVITFISSLHTETRLYVYTHYDVKQLWNIIAEDNNLIDFITDCTSAITANLLLDGVNMAGVEAIVANALSAHRNEKSLTDAGYLDSGLTGTEWNDILGGNRWFMFLYLIKLFAIHPDDLIELVRAKRG